MKSVFVKVPVNKHLAGQHDQSSHGSWAESMRVVPSTKHVQIPAKWNVNEYKQFINDTELQNNLTLNYLMDSWRSNYSVSRAMSQIIAGEKPAPAFDNESTRKNAKLLKDELDASPAFGIPSYRVARLTSDVGSSANVGDVLSFNASSVAFNPSDAMSFMRDELTSAFRFQGQQKFFFEFPSDTKGLVYDDSVTHMKDAFEFSPVEGIARGKFKVSKIVNRTIYDSSLHKNVDVTVHVLESVGDVAKHLAGQHDQSSHGNWAKTQSNVTHSTVNDNKLTNADVHTAQIYGSSFEMVFDNRDNITEDQKRDVLALVHDLQMASPMSPASEVKVIVSNDYGFDNETERGWCVNYSQKEKYGFDAKLGRTVITKPFTHQVVIAVRPEDMNYYADEEMAQQAWMPSANAKQFFAMEYFLAHEWGHAVHYDAMFHKGTDGTQSGSGLQNHETTGLMILSHIDQLSGYGQTETNEGYAEAFAEWFMTDGKSDIPIVKALAKEDGWGHASFSI